MKNIVPFPFGGLRVSLVVLLLGTVPALHAAKDAELAPVLAKPGKLLKEDSFADSALSREWGVAKGEWLVKDGILIAKEKTEDKHAGVCALNLLNHNSIIRFSYRLIGAKALTLSFNHAKGHLFRVSLGAESITLSKDKDKADTSAKPLQLAKVEAPKNGAEWTTIQVEMLGQKVAVTTDSGLKLEGEDAALDVDKTGYRFVISGESAELDGVKIWEHAP